GVCPPGAHGVRAAGLLADRGAGAAGAPRRGEVVPPRLTTLDDLQPLPGAGARPPPPPASRPLPSSPACARRWRRWRRATTQRRRPPPACCSCSATRTSAATPFGRPRGGSAPPTGR